MSIMIFVLSLFSLFFTVSVSSFTIDLIHRRSNSSVPSRISKTQLGSSPYADTVFDTVLYLMKLQIGTPPFEIEAILDTGSDVIWTQCLPCHNCYNQSGPIFDPSQSSTFKKKRCYFFFPCTYEIHYVDTSYSKGNYATETVTIKSTSGEPFVMHKTTIGCGHNNHNYKRDDSQINSSGVVGLNTGSLSLISQMGKNINGLFSYCFSGDAGTSRINFGGRVSGDGVVSTTFFTKSKDPNKYYLNLDAVSVGENRVETLGTPFYSQNGNIMIDSGTTDTFFPVPYCNLVIEAVESIVAAERVSLYEDMLCYKSETIEIFPDITMHFSGGTDLVLDKYKMFLGKGGAFCLMIICIHPTPTFQGAVFGNRAQNNFLVGYDTSSKLVSFKPTNCSTLSWVSDITPIKSLSTSLKFTIFNFQFIFVFYISLFIKQYM